MSPQITPLLTPEFRAVSGRRGLGLMSVASSTGDQTTAGYTSSMQHTYSMPVVREMPPRQAAFGHAW